MKVKIVERHMVPSGALRDYVVEKANGLERYFDRIISIDSTLSVEKERQIADFHAHLTNRKVIAAREESSDMYASIDKAIDRLKRQIVKYKDHLNDRRSTATAVSATRPPEIDTDLDHREIIRTNTYFQKPMSPEEAALQLDALEKDFLVFINVESDQISIIYHRRDENYGLIEPRR
ncbi:MAG: ribosome-associated translation inhibitor RaiA [Candidatus Bipolaricaulota bacterium]|nr:ribosome-associated translation inhibitor RaiA [Candidatus Bipolaricaulota bacterium]